MRCYCDLVSHLDSIHLLSTFSTDVLTTCRIWCMILWISHELSILVGLSCLGPMTSDMILSCFQVNMNMMFCTSCKFELH